MTSARLWNPGDPCDLSGPGRRRRRLLRHAEPCAPRARFLRASASTPYPLLGLRDHPASFTANGTRRMWPRRRLPPPKRSRSLSDQGPTDVTVAAPPEPRDEAPVPLSNQPRPRTAYALRNRLVPDTSNREPYVPARFEERYISPSLQRNQFVTYNLPNVCYY
jgi:hypothetical protein